MARRCEICGKGKMSGNNVSHAKNRNKRSWSANINKVKINVDGKIVKKRLCTKCLRTTSNQA